MGAQLTSRERQCLELVEQGLSAKEISRTLGDITDQTVETYLKRARQKLGVSSSLAAAHAMRDRTDLSDIPLGSIAAAEPPDIGLSAGSRRSGTTRQIVELVMDRLPLRREGERHNVLSRGEVLIWILRLTIIGTITISVAAAAMAMIGFIWFQGSSHS